MTALQLDQIRTDGGTQIRTETNITQAEGYAEDMAAGAVFPPIVVFWDGSDYWLGDGFHRLIAARALKRTAIDADIREGTRRDAILYAVGANAAHGLRRTSKCKRNAVRTLLSDEEWSRWNNCEIAARSGVSEYLVRRMRDELSSIKSKMDGRLVTRGGTTYAMKTGAIGAKPDPAPAPAADEPDGEADEPDSAQYDLVEYIAELAGPVAEPKPPEQPAAPVLRPRFPPAHTAPAFRIRYFVGELERHCILTQREAAVASVGEIETYVAQVARVIDWLTVLKGELNVEMSRRQRIDAAD